MFMMTSLPQQALQLAARLLSLEDSGNCLIKIFNQAGELSISYGIRQHLCYPTVLLENPACLSTILLR